MPWTIVRIRIKRSRRWCASASPVVGSTYGILPTRVNGNATAACTHGISTGWKTATALFGITIQENGKTHFCFPISTPDSKRRFSRGAKPPSSSLLPKNMRDLTIIYYTANKNSDYFMANTQKQLLRAIGDTPVVCVSFKKTIFGPNCINYCIGEQPRSKYTLYKQVLFGATKAQTKYVAMAEDDVLYSPEHFTRRPKDEEMFSYDINRWSIFSWVKPPIFSYRVRKLMNSLIVGRDALIKTLEERYRKYPVLEDINPTLFQLYWGEPGRFENHLGITPMKTEEYSSPVPNIMFSTSEALGFQELGVRKAHSNIRETHVEPWGTAEEVLKLYAP